MNRTILLLAPALTVISLACSAGVQNSSTLPSPPPTTKDLHLAVLQGDLDAVRQHVAAGSDLNRLDAYGSTPLLVASTFGRTEVARALIDGGADLRIGNREGSTPLHVAAFLGRAPLVDMLLDRGADRHLRNDDGATAFDLAVVPVHLDGPVLDQLRNGLAPLGIELDDHRIEAGRAAIAQRLRSPPAELARVDHAPTPGRRWRLSTPARHGLDQALVAELYADAAALDAIRGLLIIKDGYLVAERYFNDGAIDRPTLLQSVTKSITSALVGIALDQGCLRSLDEPMIEFLPEVATRIRDPRKRAITIRHLLQMRAGYPWEGADSARWEGLVRGDYLPLAVEFPLERDPGNGFDYSNITSHLLGVIVARACDSDLLTFAQAHLFSPIGIRPGVWQQDPRGYRYGHAELQLTARDAARFGLLYLNRGYHEKQQVVQGAWVDASLTGYSSDINTAGVRSGVMGRYFRDLAYGYQWWSARIGDRRIDFAWGHGGQLVVLVHDLDMVVVLTSDPFHRPIRNDNEAWRNEQANFNVVGKFLQLLPNAQ